LAEHNKYLILIPERITLSPRAYMQFHNHDRQLISLCEIQKCHAAKNVMRPDTHHPHKRLTEHTHALRARPAEEQERIATQCMTA
jgi:hypothetical protein